MPDSGTEKSVIALSLLAAYNIQFDKTQKVHLVTADGSPMRCEGTAHLNLTFQGKTTDVKAIVSSSLNEEFLVGWKDLINMGVLSTD